MQVETIVDKEDQSAQFHKDHDINCFLELPTKEETRACYRQFHKVTSNVALELSTCGVCAQEISM